MRKKVPDYYKILGVERNSSSEEIKKAYRKLAVQYHPDKNNGNKESEEKFKEISSAYDILGDPEKKSKYDRGDFSGFNDEDIFNGFGFPPGFQSFTMNFGDFFQKEDNDFVSNLQFSIAVDIYTVVYGRNKKFDIQIDHQCDSCKGNGKEKSAKETVCHTCGGSGQMRMRKGPMIFIQPCQECRGQGRSYEKCHACLGAKVVKKNQTIELDIPKGIKNGSVLSIRGKGNYNPSRKNFGDIHIVVGISEHDFFKVRGNDVHVIIPLTFKQMMLGCETKITSLYGEVVLNVPSETQNGATFKLANLGLPENHNSSIKGDMYVHVIVDFPRGISEEIKEKVNSIDDSKFEYVGIKDYKKIENQIKKDLEKFSK